MAVKAQRTAWTMVGGTDAGPRRADGRHSDADTARDTRQLAAHVDHAQDRRDPLFTIMLGSAPAGAEAPRDAILYKDSHCGCCEAYADHLRAHGFDVTVMPSSDLARIKRQHGVPGALALRLASGLAWPSARRPSRRYSR